MWLALHKSLQVNAYRFHCNMAQNPLCVRCSGETDDVLHCLRDCPHARELWTRLGALSWQNFTITEANSWLKWHATGPNALKFIAGLWANWKWRNNSIFEETSWTIEQLGVLCAMITMKSLQLLAV